MAIHPISQERFDLLALNRLPHAKYLAEEQEWYSDDAELAIGAVFRDRSDGDYCFVSLTRGTRGVFETHLVECNFRRPRDAREALRRHLRDLVATQRDALQEGRRVRDAWVDLFEPITPPERWHPGFRKLVESRAYSPAREVIRELGNWHRAVDRNFVEQFQTNGFDARIWELYLHIALHEEGLVVSMDHPSPDFVCTRPGLPPVAIEAVTVNPSQVREEFTPAERPEVAQEYLRNYIPIKYGSSLTSKLARRYWNLPHTQGLPLVLAIHDFHMAGSMMWTHSAISEYLYGFRYSHYYEGETLRVVPHPIERHIWEDKEIPSGFFNLPDAEHISAVLFTSGGTISKFGRIGKLAEFGDLRARLHRTGLQVDHDPNASKPIGFSLDVVRGRYFEQWTDDLSLFHNPRAVVPVVPETFPSMAHHRLTNANLIQTASPPRHVFTSLTTFSHPDERL